MLSELLKSFAVGLAFFIAIIGLVWLCFNHTSIAATIATVIACVVVGNVLLRMKDYW